MDEVVSEEENHAGIYDISSSVKEIETEVKLSDFMKSKDGKIIWQNEPFSNSGRLEGSNILNQTPGPTGFSVVRVKEGRKAFELLFSHNLKTMIVKYTNLKGKGV